MGPREYYYIQVQDGPGHNIELWEAIEDGNQNRSEAGWDQEI